MWRRLLARTLVLSIALHLLVFFSLRGRDRSVAPAPIEIQIRQTPPLRPTSGHAGHETPTPKKGVGRPAMPLGKLQPLWTRGETAAGRAARAEAASGDSPPREEDWGSHGGVLAEIEHDGKYQALLLEARGLLSYPYKLARRGIQGSVNARLYFDQNSHCDWSRARIGGDNHYLRVYVVALLKKLCTLTAVERARFKKDQFADLSFAFTADQEQLPEQNSVNGNVIMFRRSFQKSMLEYNLGPIHGFLFAPAVTIDSSWIIEN